MRQKLTTRAQGGAHVESGVTRISLVPPSHLSPESPSAGRQWRQTQLGTFNAGKPLWCKSSMIVLNVFDGRITAFTLSSDGQ